MLFIKTYNKDINGNKLPNGEYVKEYTITQGDTFTLTITDPNGAMQRLRALLTNMTGVA